MTPAPGRIVFLNGTSSSGKSAIAAELLDLMDRPWFHLAVDMFGAMRSVSRTAGLDGDALAEVLRRTRAGFHRAVAGMAAAGNDVVMDHVLTEPWRLADCLDLFTPYDVIFVGLRCDAAELTRREQARGDRVPGQAVRQLDLVHAHGRYDLEVDTARYTARECAEQIREFAGTHHGTAFAHLRALASSSHARGTL